MSSSKNVKFKEKYSGYIEGITYIILTIVIIFTNIAGPIEIRLLPFIFVLGIVGRVIFNRPVITSIFGFIVSICTIYIIGTYSFSYILMYSLFCFICILIGEAEGTYILRFFGKENNKKYNKNSRDIVAFILIALSGIYLNNYVNGNIYSYIKSKQLVKNHINLNYPDSDNAKIMDGKYIFNKYKYYSFNVKNIDVNDPKSYKFAVYSDNKIIDGYESSRLIINSKLLKTEFREQVQLSEYKNFIFDIKYNDLNNNITIYITKIVNDISSKELHNFSNDVNNILDSMSTFDKFSNVNKLNICLKDDSNMSSAEIYSENFYDTEYYINSLDTEYLYK